MLRVLLAGMLGAIGGTGGAMGYVHYAEPQRTTQPQVVMQSDPQIHADLAALHETMLESLRLNQEAWGQNQADRAQRQAQVNRWNSDLHEFNQKAR